MCLSFCNAEIVKKALKHISNKQDGQIKTKLISVQFLAKLAVMLVMLGMSKILSKKKLF